MFTGFTDATVDFLWGIRFNNERPWFEAHKETYLSELSRAGAEPPRLPDLPGRPAALRPRPLQGPPVVLRGAPRRGLDHPADILV